MLKNTSELIIIMRPIFKILISAKTILLKQNALRNVLLIQNTMHNTKINIYIFVTKYIIMHEVNAFKPVAKKGVMEV